MMSRADTGGGGLRVEILFSSLCRTSEPWKCI